MLSVVIPALNEAAHLDRLLPLLNHMVGVAEVVVCDGGSDDATTDVARRHGATVVHAPRNRGAQLNAGATDACGSVLWFLHADTRPHPRSAAAIQRVLQSPRTVGGTFRLCFDSPAAPARVFEAIARVQRRHGVSYGDSGLFVRRDTFASLGGYRAWPLFEDYDFARRLDRHSRRHGLRTVRSPLPITASARRFARRPWRTLLLWATLQTLFSLGVSPGRLAKLYRR